MQYNYKTLENNGVGVVFNNPGYQKNQDDLSSLFNFYHHIGGATYG
jgi:hypothetical protein